MWDDFKNRLATFPIPKTCMTSKMEQLIIIMQHHFNRVERSQNSCKNMISTYIWGWKMRIAPFVLSNLLFT